jgi:hypothetical protein
MLRRKISQEKKTPVKGEPVKVEKPVIDTICSECGKKRPYSNKSKKLCAVCVKKSQIAKVKEKKAKARQKKAESIGVLTKKLDRIFSVFVRLSGTKKDHSTKCFTCEKVLHWREIQCGHFQSRRFYSTRFHELNCKPQCYACNIGLSGNQYTFGVNLDKLHGQGTAESMVRMSREVKKFTSGEMMDMIAHYELKVGELRKELNIWE